MQRLRTSLSAYPEAESMAQTFIKFFTERRPLIIEGILIICLFSVTGHITFNTWHRLVIKSQLSNVNTDLFTLTETIDIIHNEYDHLHDKVHKLANVTFTALDKESTPCKGIDEQSKNPKNNNAFETKNNDKEILKECQNNKNWNCKYAKDIANSHGKSKMEGAGDMKH